MPIMSSDDFSIHADDCDSVGGGMPITTLLDEVASIDDLECECWDGFDSLTEID